ncbi:hypothetical protein DL93DRAFT_2091045 [Clavulina sp. PMI_390]|nr:hypothetical protein DL93DRAFT_2091045 [Clavulina sp. PMI_390]
MSAAAGPAAPQESDVGTKFKELNAHPLFMTNLPDDSESNAPLEALQSLIYDDTPDNTASGFKEQGNDYFKKQKFTDARKFYTQAIDAKPEDQTLLESLYLNRAACNLKLRESFFPVCPSIDRLDGPGLLPVSAFQRTTVSLSVTALLPSS